MQPYDDRYFALPISEDGGDELRIHTQGYLHHMPLVLMHGAWQSRFIFQPYLASLSSNYYLISYDLRGHGESGKPEAKRAYSLSQFAKDLHQIAAFFGLEDHPWGVLGASALTPHILHQYLEDFGGRTGLNEIYLIEPERHPSPSVLGQIEALDDMSLQACYLLMRQVASHMQLVGQDFWEAFRDVLVVSPDCSLALAGFLRLPAPAHSPTS